MREPCDIFPQSHEGYLMTRNKFRLMQIVIIIKNPGLYTAVLCVHFVWPCSSKGIISQRYNVRLYSFRNYKQYGVYLADKRSENYRTLFIRFNPMVSLYL